MPCNCTRCKVVAFREINVGDRLANYTITFGDKCQQFNYGNSSNRCASCLDFFGCGYCEGSMKCRGGSISGPTLDSDPAYAYHCTSNWLFGSSSLCPSTCGTEGCLLSEVGNGMCQSACLNQECQFDGGDCGGASPWPSSSPFDSTPLPQTMLPPVPLPSSPLPPAPLPPDPLSPAPLPSNDTSLQCQAARLDAQSHLHACLSDLAVSPFNFPNFYPIALSIKDFWAKLKQRPIRNFEIFVGAVGVLGSFSKVNPTLGLAFTSLTCTQGAIDYLEAVTVRLYL